MQYEVKHNSRTIKFDGRRLSRSTSKRPDSDRWVEFALYVTASGTYVFERIGQSNIFHHIDCEVVERNDLEYDPQDILEDRHVPCDICYPDEEVDDIIIEKPRYFALVSDHPAAVLEALHKKDSNGARYMTKVAERLIEEACEHDKRLEKAYRVEHIA
jgi:hypothetical protein